MRISTPIRGSAATLAIATTLGALVPAAAAQPAAASLPVTKTADTNDGACDSDCSVREAVIAANSSPGMDTIVLPAGTYQLALGSRGEDGATGGDLDITDPLTVTGAATADTIIDGGLIDRVFHVDPLAAGGVAASFSELTIRNGAVGGDSGGGIASTGDLTLTRVRVSSNRAQSSAAIDAGGRTFIHSSTISGNGVTDWAVANYGAMTVTRSTVSGTFGFTGGGHGFFNVGSLTIENSTISGSDGRGVSSLEDGALSVDSSTIAGNGGVGVASGGGHASVQNSVLADGVTNGDCLDPLVRSIVSGGHNLVSAGANGICGFTPAPSDLLDIDPLLGPLADNGGPTETRALLAGSPALDHGDDLACHATDQRGVARPQGPHCDIGAFEAEPAAPGNTPGGNPQVVFGALTISFTGVAPPGGDTTVSQSNTGPPPPAGFEVMGSYYEIATTATFASAELCFDYRSSPPPSIVHFENGVPRELSTTRDTGQQVCAVVTSFSPFALVVPVPSDTAVPQLQLPGDITVDATDPAGAIVSYEASARDDVDPSPALECNPASGNRFAIGQTTVRCHATDEAGNSTSGSFLLTVRSAPAQLVALIDKTLAYLELSAVEATLRARLEAAAAALVQYKKPAACRALDYYIAAVRAAPVRVLNATEKAELVADATRIETVIGCA